MTGKASQSARYVADCLLGLVLACLLPVSTASALDLRDDGVRVHDLDAHLRFLLDPAASMDLAAAREALDEGRFVRSDVLCPNFGFTHAAVWAHINLSNLDPATNQWLLLIEQPRLDEITVYLVSPDGGVTTSMLGDRLPFSARAEALRWPNTLLELPYGQSRDLLLRVRSTSSMQLPLRLLTPDRAWVQSHAAQFTQGALLGVLLALFLYSLGVWLLVREPAYLDYLVLVAALALLLAAINGVAFQYLWPQFPYWQNVALPLGIGATLAAGMRFTRRFLEIERNLPHWLPLFRWAPWVVLSLALVGFTPWQLEVTVVLNVLVWLLVVLMTVAAVLCALRRWRPAYAFLGGWAALIVGGIATALSSLGFISRTPLIEGTVQFGGVAGMLLLAVSLAYRLQMLRSEAERVTRETADMLERRVGERTAEIELAARQLEELNVLLRDMSLRDGLTGLYNRRCLDQVLLEAWKTTIASGEPLSLLMIDIDHFKQLNDRHGHGPGDDCLREVAQRLSRHSTTLGGVVARYGGEEFVVVLAHTNANMAQALADALRTAISGVAIKTSVASLSVTVSIGVTTTLAGGRDSLAAMIKRADEALYRAKRDGRNRVVTG